MNWLKSCPEFMGQDTTLFGRENNIHQQMKEWTYVKNVIKISKSGLNHLKITQK